MDKLDELSATPSHGGVKFISICCDSTDGARDIIEAPEKPRWSNVSHYSTTVEEKEKAKAHFGFAQVPFYVVVDKDGSVFTKGNKVDFQSIPGVARPVEAFAEEKKEERSFTMDEDF